MKRILIAAMFAVIICTNINAKLNIATQTENVNQQNQAQITFDKTTHSFGTFEEAKLQTCIFTFINTGSVPLIINQAVASCGCTVPTYTKSPIAPGQTGQIKVTYNGKGKFPGHFKKSITVRTNGTPEVVRLYIEGDMTVKD